MTLYGAMCKVQMHFVPCVLLEEFTGMFFKPQMTFSSFSLPHSP